MFSKPMQFFAEVRTELRKATWPWDPKEHGFKRYKELSDSTLVVVVAMLLLGGYVALWDLILNYIVGLLTR
jgi:preprotein translocase subunit SecE